MFWFDTYSLHLLYDNKDKLITYNPISNLPFPHTINYSHYWQVQIILSVSTDFSSYGKITYNPNNP